MVTCEYAGLSKGIFAFAMQMYKYFNITQSRVKNIFEAVKDCVKRLS
jgi:hypothetical protein